MKAGDRGSVDNGEVILILESDKKGGTMFYVKKAALQLEMSDKNIGNIQQIYEIPHKCASQEVLQLFERYTTDPDLNMYKSKRGQTEILIGTLRLADFLGLSIFQESFISEVVIQSINIGNCISFLEETHKKLKNQQNGSQCWYSLLNACISFLAQNLTEAYNRSEDKIKGLHEKILNEILDRAIRNGNNDQEKIFDLIMKSRKANSVHHLCEILRKSIMSKKINAKIHAKLSWKLQDVMNITEKKTKVFKFLEYQWMLSATRSNNNDLNVDLIYCGINKKQIGSFYIKLMWWLDGKIQSKRQEQMRINYLLMNQKYDLRVMTLTENMQRQLGKSKIELSIFCCMDQIYTFVLNYIAKNSQRINLQERNLTLDELQILARLFKEKEQYVSSIRYLKYMSTMTNNLPKDLIFSFPTKQLGTYELDFIQKIKSQRGLEASSRLPPPSEISEANSVSSYSRKSQQKQQRPQSRGRLRKIFASSPSSRASSTIEAPSNTSAVKLDDINRITNLRNYFWDKSNPLYYQV